MTPEQTAREWAEKAYPRRPHSLDLETVVYNARQEVLQEVAMIAYLTGYRESLTSLLDELPGEEPSDGGVNYRDGWNDYREAIISLIQNKLK